MGIGEPLDNFDNVVRFLKLINHPKGRNIGMRHISLSTCGLNDGIDKLAELNLQLTLSVSLHAPDDETRSKIMPVNKGCGVDALMDACERYFKRTGRRISFEYAMIDGLNDTEQHAKLLAARVKKTGGHVNLIPMNLVEEREFKHSSPRKNIKAFIGILEGEGINVTVRRRRGGDVDASCGQLRIKESRRKE
jgi:23S rRNA (adenine2503-C2)-methyltransferase